MVYVSRNDGKCRECGGPLTITDADDATMQVACETCGAEYSVEPDAFGDGGIEYWPAIMAELKASE